MENILTDFSTEVQQLYEGTLHFTKLTEYGISFQDLLSGKSLPLFGARFDVEYEGSVQGTKLNGTVTGSDYLSIRADGRIYLHIHGSLFTSDGAKISYFAEGVGSRKNDSPLTEVHENVELYSAFPNYAWVNNLAVWSKSVIDPINRQIRVNAYIP